MKKDPFKSLVAYPSVTFSTRGFRLKLAPLGIPLTLYKADIDGFNASVRFHLNLN